MQRDIQCRFCYEGTGGGPACGAAVLDINFQAFGWKNPKVTTSFLPKHVTRLACPKTAGAVRNRVVRNQRIDGIFRIDFEKPLFYWEINSSIIHCYGNGTYIAKCLCL